jgi:hypothetical protein
MTLDVMFVIKDSSEDADDSVNERFYRRECVRIPFICSSLICLATSTSMSTFAIVDSLPMPVPTSTLSCL